MSKRTPIEKLEADLPAIRKLLGKHGAFAFAVVLADGRPVSYDASSEFGKPNDRYALSVGLEAARGVIAGFQASVPTIDFSLPKGWKVKQKTKRRKNGKEHWFGMEAKK